MSEPSAQVVKAIQALYHSNDRKQQEEANNWLMAFATSAPAWGVSFALLEPTFSPEVQYFAANILLSKVRSECQSLTPEQRSQLIQTISGRLHQSEQAYSKVVTQRLCLVLAVAAVSSGTESTTQLLQQVLSGLASPNGEQMVAVYFQLLGSIAEETDMAERVRRQALVPALMPFIPRVLDTLSASLTASVSLASNGTLPVAQIETSRTALFALLKWFQMSNAGMGSTSALSSGKLAVSHPNTFRVLVQALALQDADAIRTMVEVWQALLQSEVSSGQTDEGMEQAAMHALAEGIVSQGTRMCSALESDETRLLMQIAVALIERDAELVAKGEHQMLQLCDILLQCVKSGERSTVEVSMEFFTHLNTVPVAERHPQLQESLFSRLLQLALKQAELPAGFTSWAEWGGDDDADSFHRFRDQILLDVLDSCFTIMKARYFHAIAAAIRVAGTWQCTEALLYSIRSIHISVKALVLSERLSDLSDASVIQSKQEINSFLRAIFGQLGDPSTRALFSSHPLVIQQASRLVGDYASWLAVHPASLNGLLQYVFQALLVPDAWTQAARAFRSLCSRCTKHLQDDAIVQGLVEGVKQVLPSIPFSPTEDNEADDERTAVVEGLARLIASLQNHVAIPLALSLASPLISSAQEVAASLDVSKSPELSAWLRLLSSEVRFLESESSAERNPAMALLESSWPLLGGVAAEERWCSSVDVVDALCMMYDRLLLATKVSALPFVPTLLPLLQGIFLKHSYASCLDTLAVVVEVFAPDSNEEMWKAISQTLGTMVQACLQRVQHGDISQHVDVLRALYDMCHKCLVFVPNLFVTSDTAFVSVLQVLPFTLRTPERDPLRSMLVFISYLFSPSAKAATRPEWHQLEDRGNWAIQTHGEALTGALLFASADSCPRHLLQTLAGALYAVVTHRAASHREEWIIRALQRADFPAATGAIGDNEKQLFCEVALRKPPLSKPRFQAMISDFASICRKECTVDALVAYQF